MLVSEILAVLKKAGLKDDVAVADLTARLDILVVLKRNVSIAGVD